MMEISRIVESNPLVNELLLLSQNCYPFALENTRYCSDGTRQVIFLVNCKVCKNNNSKVNRAKQEGATPTTGSFKIFPPKSHATKSGGVSWVITNNIPMTYQEFDHLLEMDNNEHWKNCFPMYKQEYTKPFIPDIGAYGSMDPTFWPAVNSIYEDMQRKEKECTTNSDKKKMFKDRRIKMETILEHYNMFARTTQAQHRLPIQQWNSRHLSTIYDKWANYYKRANRHTTESNTKRKSMSTHAKNTLEITVRNHLKRTLTQDPDISVILSEQKKNRCTTSTNGKNILGMYISYIPSFNYFTFLCMYA